jgi:NAD+ synthase (glutamine-hydrolysing)
MNNMYGFVRVASAIPSLRVADCRFNAGEILTMMQKAEQEKVQIVCFPELCITGYTCADLFFQHQLLKDAEKALMYLKEASKPLHLTSLVGMPLQIGNRLYNTAVVLQNGRIAGIVPKISLPNNNEFYEKRWFASGRETTVWEIAFQGEKTAFGTDLLFENNRCTFSIELCEDLWTPIPPSSQQSLHGSEIIFNLSAGNELTGKHKYRKQLIEQQSARCNAGYVYASCGHGESTTDVVFTGNGIIAENGHIIAESARFSFEPQLTITEIDVERLRSERMRNTNFEQGKSSDAYRRIQLTPFEDADFTLSRTFGKHPFVPSEEKQGESCHDIFSIQVGGLAKRWLHTASKTLVLGISGGLDSTLALLVCIKTCDKLGFDRKQIIGITMPGFGTTERTYNNAVELMKSLGITWFDIPIREASLLHFKAIEHDPETHDVTYENVQARERTQILMNMANKHNGMVIGTGDLSELALGWATYNGDHMSMYAVNAGIPKTLVRYLVDWASQELDEKSERILKDVLDTPVSPELLPADKDGQITQKTEDLVGPYELHDFFLYYFLRFGFSPEKILYLACRAFKNDYEKATIKHWLKVFLKRFFSQQFKRSCMPDGPKVGSINLSPRGDWRMPSDAVAFTLDE